MKKVLLHRQFKNYRQEVDVLWSCYKFHQVQLNNGFKFIASTRLYYFEDDSTSESFDNKPRKRNTSMKKKPYKGR